MNLKTTLRLLWGVCLSATLLNLAACDGDRETRVARWPLSVFPAAEKKGKSIATLSKGERVDLLEPGETFSKVRLAGGTEGFVESKHLFVRAAVLVDRDSRLYVRPSASSGVSRHDKKLQPGVVFFVGERVQNEEGIWLSVQGGSRDTYFSGWLSAAASFNETLAIVQEGFALEKAIRAKDLTALDELSAQPAPIGAAAAVALADLGSLPEDEEASEGGDSESGANDESAGEDGDSSTSAEASDAPEKNDPAASPQTGADANAGE